jgi:lipoprotein NlpD
LKRGRRASFALVLLGGLGLAGCTSNMAPVEGRGEAIAGSYVVERGDTLYSIAWRNGLDFRALARWNRIDPPYVIHPGQRLRLSLRVDKAAVAPVASAPKPPARPPASPA